MEAIDLYIQRLSEPGVRDRLRQMYHVDEDEVSREVATEEQVAAAERELGLPLPPSYKKLITTVSPYDGGYEIHGIDDPHGLGAGIVGANQGREGRPFPPYLIGVVPCPNGDTFCFDTRYPDKREEYPIVLFDHEVHSEDTEEWAEFETVNNDLGEFLLGCLGEEPSGEAKRGAPRIWELPASTVIRKGRSFTRRQLNRSSRRVVSALAALRSRLGSPPVQTQKPANREWLWKKMSPLLAAVDAGDLQKAAELLAEGADPNAVSHSSTPLRWALREKNQEMVLLLLKHGADPRSLDGYQSYFKTAFERDPSLGAWFLQQVPDVTVLDVAEAGTLEDVRKLVDAGGNVNMASNDERHLSPLHAAVMRQHLEMVAFLLSKGADPNARTSAGGTALHLASDSVQLTELLLRQGADPNAVDKAGQTPLYLEVRSRTTDVMGALIRGGADVNARTPDGSTPLHSVATRCYGPPGPAIRMLVEHGAELHAQDHRGYTPLHVAMDETNAEAAMTLLDLGADPKILDKEGRTPPQLVRDSVKLYPGIPEVVRRIGQIP
jgi:ankyrin repeat protein